MRVTDDDLEGYLAGGEPSTGALRDVLIEVAGDHLDEAAVAVDAHVNAELLVWARGAFVRAVELIRTNASDPIVSDGVPFELDIDYGQLIYWAGDTRISMTEAGMSADDITTAEAWCAQQDW